MKHKDMNIIKFNKAYIAPTAELFVCHEPLNLLVSLSGSGTVGDWEDEGEELQSQVPDRYNESSAQPS